MEILIYPEIFDSHVKAFFTGKTPGIDREEISKIAAIKKENIYLPIQKHTDKILSLDPDFSPKIADAVITKDRGVLIGVEVADCIPVLLYDSKKLAIGVVHVGWRGTVAEILKKTIKAMCYKFGSVPDDIMVALGPSIRWCCYRVGYDVVEFVMRATMDGGCHNPPFSKGRIGGMYYLDLATANKYQAMSLGIPKKNIWTSQECTYCNPDRFYSYRYAKWPTGRQGGFIGIL